MNSVISGYFDDAHRGLQRQRPEHKPAAFIGVASNVQPLPPLRGDSVSPSTSMYASFQDDRQGGGGMGKSNSTGAIDLGGDLATRGVLDQRLSQALMENGRLAKKMRALQDQLSITTAKKEAFRAQALRLEKEFKRGREQTDQIQKELLEAKRDVSDCSKESTEAVQMMNEMRKAHLQEVRLLQRGLEARGNDEKFRNRVNEVADLVDKLGRSVIQRDEALRDKAKSQAQMNKMTTDLRALADECSKLRRQNKNIEAKLKEAVRKGKAVHPPKVNRENAEFDESDEEFEVELLHFEKRFSILEEGPMGLDILASNLARDKRLLEKALKEQQEAQRATLQSLQEWQTLSARKDVEITQQNKKIEEMMMAQAALEEAIEEKKREVEEAVNAERERLEIRMKKLMDEAAEAKAQAQDMVLASDKLSQQLVNVHEQYDEATSRKKAEKEELASGLAAAQQADQEPDPEDGQWVEEERRENFPMKVNDQEEPRSFDLAVWKDANNGQFQLRYRPVGTNVEEQKIAIPPEYVETLDKETPWLDFLSTRVGLSSDSSPQVVIGDLLAETPTKLPPDQSEVLCKLYRFDKWRYCITGVSMSNMGRDPFEYVMIKAEIEPFSDLVSDIESGADNDTLIKTLLSKMHFSEDQDGFFLAA